MAEPPFGPDFGPFSHERNSHAAFCSAGLALAFTTVIHE